MVFVNRRLLRISTSCVLIHEHVVHELFKCSFVLNVSLGEVRVIQMMVVLGNLLILRSSLLVHLTCLGLLRFIFI